MVTVACGSPKGWLKKAANYKFPKTHPDAYMAFSRMSFDAGMIGLWLLLLILMDDSSRCC